MSIEAVKTNFLESKNEVNVFIEFVKKCLIENAKINRTKITSENQKILKASIFLILYNVMEATITSIIYEIIDSINNDNLKYNDLIDEVQKKWLNINYKDSLRECKPTDFSKKVHDMVQICFSDISINIRKDIKKHLSGGNLDSDQIKQVCFLFGVKILKNCDALDIAKKNRNKLAHGEVSFSKLGADYTITDIDKHKKNIFSHLDSVIKTTEAYLTTKKYKIKQ